MLTLLCLLAQDELKEALQRLRAPAGFHVELAAAEPLFVNGVAFAIDEQGRFYISETHRIKKGVYDIRDGDKNHWMDDDLACRTVEDRVAMHRKHMGERFSEMTAASELVRLVVDRDGDGRADHSTVFAEGFSTPADGIASGVLARRGDVYFANIPTLWKLRDADGDGKADARAALHTGYGVHIAFYGHDLHGLTVGPDGLLYFTIGDRGLHVVTPRGPVSFPDGGAVLRCALDGSNLELVHVGLRNPQELAFDQYGNLFTGDNNNDHGDRARLVYIVEGGDSGWRIGHQNRGGESLWMQEGIWKPETPLPWRVPPVATIGRGPSGLAFYPGTGLPARYDGQFFMCDFPGGIRSFAVKPKGAFFEMVDEHEFLWDLWPTDVDFGPDGFLYVLDWVDGWGMPEKGRIFRVKPAGAVPDKDLQALIAGPMEKRPTPELAALLGHRDQRVRQEAHFALAARKEAAALAGVAATGKGLARLHAIWGLGMMGAEIPPALLTDPDAEVRAQAARLTGSLDELIKLTKDESPRVRFFAALTLGKLGRREAAGALIAMIRANDDKDPMLRHAGVMGLAGIGEVESPARDGSRAVRLAALLAMRRLGSPDIRRFLDDPDPTLVLEAARAIYDTPIPGAMEALAKRADLPERARLRALHAALRLGKPEGLDAVLRRVDAPALRVLGAWADPPGRDGLTGLWRPAAPRDGAAARAKIEPVVRKLLEGGDLKAEAVRAARQLDLRGLAPLMAGAGGSPEERIEMLQTLAAWKSDAFPGAVQKALGESNRRVRREAMRLLPEAGLPGSAEILKPFALEGATDDRQAAIGALGRLGAEAILEPLMDQLLAGTLPPALHLDLLEAAKDKASLKARLQRHEDARKKHDPLAPWAESIEGGDAEIGRRIFMTKTSVVCLKCHAVDDEGGQVGPDLSKVGERLSRRDLLESIVTPNAKITEGYGQILIVLKDESGVTGRIVEETAKHVVLMDAEGNRTEIVKAEIEARKPRLSAMAEGLDKGLTRREMRNLIEFLFQLK